MGRSAENSGSLPSDFASLFPVAAAALEGAVHELLASGWDEPLRKHAHEMAAAMAAGAKDAGWKETAGVLGAVNSILALPLGEVLSVREELRDKLIELLDLLREDPLAESA
jgi:hypothetical protein